MTGVSPGGGGIFGFSCAPNKSLTGVRTEKITRTSASLLTCLLAPDPASNHLQLWVFTPPPTRWTAANLQRKLREQGPVGAYIFISKACLKF